ncbi:Hypothetical_protein [Hexamita inflata]|uniref:Hypothetical_protein n=1 Tax=Hexamita inflata TaxID=28002 RepID=A0AA86PJ47_9EUKA|nr:Hypothetical protein HINF_LOCUS25808 [Hexamita inflata]
MFEQFQTKLDEQIIINRKNIVSFNDKKFQLVPYDELLMGVTQTQPKSQSLLDIQNAFRINCDQNTFYIESLIKAQLEIDSSYIQMLDQLIEIEQTAKDNVDSLKSVNEIQKYLNILEAARNQMRIIIALPPESFQQYVSRNSKESQQWIDKFCSKCEKLIEEGQTELIDKVEHQIALEQSLQEALSQIKNKDEAEKIIQNVAKARAKIWRIVKNDKEGRVVIAI